MHEEEIVLSLENLGGGAAAEMFNAELQNALDNIADPNTKPDQPREVTLKLKIKPHESRRSAMISIEATSKLAAVKPQTGMVFIGRHKGRNVATDTNPQQLAFGAEMAGGRAS
jgi:hypothetical protein